MKRSRVARTAVSLTALTLVAAGGAYALDRAGGTGSAAPPRVALASYRSFTDCADLATYLRTQALPLVGPYGLGAAPGVPVPLMAEGVAPGVARATAGGEPSAVADAGAAATSGTGTNVQVAGVDEADITKRSGDLMLTVAAGEQPGLTVLRGGDGAIRVVGRLRTDWRPEQVLVQGTKILLLGTVPVAGGGPTPGPANSGPANSGPANSGPANSGPATTGGEAIRGRTRTLLPVAFEQERTRIAEVDASDPTHPRLVRTLDLDGTLVGARLAGGVVRLAVSSTATHLHFVTPDGDTPDGTGTDGGSSTGGSAAEGKALADNQRIVRNSTAQDWLPRYTLTPAGGRATSGPLLACERVGVPAEFSGPGTLGLLTFDLRSGGVDRWDGGGVVAGGSTLYSTGDRTYVATQRWLPPVMRPGVRSGMPPGIAVRPQGPQHTVVHAFDTSANGVHYLGSGEVDGSLLNQYAMDEYQGGLRVATTTRPTVRDGVQPPRATPDAPIVPRPPVAVPSTFAAVTVLQLREGRLVQVGRLDGLGAGETVHGVRFAGPQAYVVTFRQTDPLFVLDLADPAHPRLAGELALRGYSAYLHPLGGGLLLGVGQDASASGERTGLQMSLFDVSDAAHPRLLDRVALPGAWAQTESDAHAFTYAGGLALVPLQTDAMVTVPPGGSSSGAGEGAVVAVRVDGRRLTAPTLLHLGSGGASADGVGSVSLRSFVAGGSIWTVAPAGTSAVAAVHDASSLRWLSSLTF